MQDYKVASFGEVLSPTRPHTHTHTHTHTFMIYMYLWTIIVCSLYYIMWVGLDTQTCYEFGKLVVSTIGRALVIIFKGNMHFSIQVFYYYVAIVQDRPMFVFECFSTVIGICLILSVYILKFTAFTI